MILSLLLGLIAMSACLALQAAALLYAQRYFAWADERRKGHDSLWAGFVQFSVLMGCLMLGNVIQIGIWALLYRLLGAFDDFETASYFSGVTFTTLGYGDVLLTGRLRFLAPLEAANGVLMFGLTTAALLAAAPQKPRRRAASRSAEVARKPDTDGA